MSGAETLMLTRLERNRERRIISTQAPVGGVWESWQRFTRGTQN
jgi:hypothetical protein